MKIFKNKEKRKVDRNHLSSSSSSSSYFLLKKK